MIIIVKIKKKRNNEREEVRCEKSHDGIWQLVICLKIKVNAVFLSWISLKKSTGNSQGLMRLSNMVVYQMKKLQNVSNFGNISILWLENKSESSLERS